VQRLRRAILAAIVRSRTALWLIRTARGMLAVRPKAKFGLHQAFGHGRVAQYRVGGDRAVVVVEHGSPDVDVLGEIFRGGEYAPPRGVDSWLARPDGDRLAVDLGMNVGLFALYAWLELGATHVIGLEPDDRNARMLERLVAANRLEGVIEMERACASNRNGTTEFVSGETWTSHVAGPGEDGGVPTPTRDAFELLAGVTILKMDIEGAEWEILTDPRWREVAVPVVVVEYHSHLCPFDSPRSACLGALEDAGYSVAERRAGEEQGTAWGIQRGLVEGLAS
jgi:FkbM family methyltransferase